MAEFWLISAPLDKASLQALQKLARMTSRSGLASSCRFLIPELKVGTLDVLLGLSDELLRLDTLAESLLRRMSQCLMDMMEPTKKKQENTLANGGDLVNYVTHFQWDGSKYPVTLPLESLTEVIAKQMSQIEVDMNSRSSAYSGVKLSLESLTRRAEGSLLTRALTDVVKQEDLVLNSEYLTTLLVVVTREDYQLWEKTYEALSEFVVPRSSRKVLDEKEGGIFTVTLFKKAVSEFKDRARQSRFNVRDFHLEDSEHERAEKVRLRVDKQEQYGTFMRWLKLNFNEVFIAWVHVKALRVFVESVLRYGLPVNFQALLLQPDRKRSKKLRELLCSLFKHLDMVAASKPDVGVDIPGVSTGTQEYYSYICFKVDINLVGT